MSSFAPKDRAYWILLLLLVAGSGAAVRMGLSEDRNGATVPETLQSLQPQGDLRVLRVLAVSSPAPSPGQQLPHFQGLPVLTGVPDGGLFVVDSEDNDAVTELADDGALVQRHSGGTTPPMRSVSGLAVDAGHVWVADLLGRAIYVLDRATGKWAVQHTAEEPYRLQPVGAGDRHLVVMRVGGKQLFDIVDQQGQVVTSFGDLLKDQSDTSLALDGYMTRSGDSIVFSGKHLGMLASFEMDGTSEWVVEPVAAPKKPVVMRADDRIWVEHELLQASEGIAALPSTVCVLVRRVEGTRMAAYIDLYSQAQGKYRGSIELPIDDRWNSLAVNNHSLFVAHRDGIFRWPVGVLSATDGNGERPVGTLIGSVGGDSVTQGLKRP